MQTANVTQTRDNLNLMNNELVALKKVLYIHKRMVQAEKEFTNGEVVSADELFTEMRAIALGKAHVALR